MDIDQSSQLQDQVKKVLTKAFEDNKSSLDRWIALEKKDLYVTTDNDNKLWILGERFLANPNDEALRKDVLSNLTIPSSKLKNDLPMYDGLMLQKIFLSKQALDEYLQAKPISPISDTEKLSWT